MIPIIILLFYAHWNVLMVTMLKDKILSVIYVFHHVFNVKIQIHALNVVKQHQILPIIR
jgi:hypothetical protein